MEQTLLYLSTLNKYMPGMSGDIFPMGSNFPGSVDDQDVIKDGDDESMMFKNDD